MKTTEMIIFAALAVFAVVTITLRFSNDSWEQEAVGNGVARYHPDTGKFEWTNVRILPQWDKIKQTVEFLDEQRKSAKFRQQIPQIMPSPQQGMPQGYQANSY